MLRVARRIDRTEVEGPGLRAAIWLQGCTLDCPGCCNPDLLPEGLVAGGQTIAPGRLAAEIAELGVQGVTLLGGEPLQQARPLRAFLEALRARADLGVWLFTGYTEKAVRRDPARAAVVALCDLWIAGPYLREQAPDPRRWIGSRNQTIHFETDRYRHLEGETQRGPNWDVHRNELEVHVRDGEILVNGFPVGTRLLDERA